MLDYKSVKCPGNAHINVFPQVGGGGAGLPWELDNFENLGSNSLPMWQNFVSKIPWMGLQI